MTLGEVPHREGVVARVVAFVRQRWWLVGGVVLLLAGAVAATVLLATPDYPRAAWPPRCTGTATHSAAPTTMVEPVRERGPVGRDKRRRVHADA